MVERDDKPHPSSKTDPKAQLAIDGLMSQGRLTGSGGIQVRLTNQNQVFLNTWRPTRVAIPSWLLEKFVVGFESGKKSFVRANFGKATSYHLYNGGQTWVPTVPKSVGKPNDILNMKLSLLTQSDFLNRFPSLRMGTRRVTAWMTDSTDIEVSEKGGHVIFCMTQFPPMEGIASYSVKGNCREKLAFEHGSLFSTIEIKDIFSVPRNFELHHDGHRRAWISIRGRDSFKIRLLSFDGVRWRVVYRWSKGYYTTVIYLSDPSELYDVGGSELATPRIDCPWADRSFQFPNINPKRPLEHMMVQHASFYETGRIGAEITYSVLKTKLGIKGLILQEPGRGGPDLRTRDGRIVAESRFIVQVEPDQLEYQIMRDLAQMTRKTRREFRRNSNSELGYAVISYFDAGKINSLVLEIASPK